MRATLARMTWNVSYPIIPTGYGLGNEKPDESELIHRTRSNLEKC